jgi:hypothetical protein
MTNNKQQTSVEWFVEQLQKTRDWQRVINEANQSSSSVRDVVQQAKEMESRQSHRYATFCLRCANENLPIIRFKDWIDLEGGEQ